MLRIATRSKWGVAKGSSVSWVAKFLEPVFGRTDFSRIFIFEPPDFVADFVAGYFLLIFVGKSAQKNPPRKSPAKSSKIYTTKIPDNFLQRGQAKSSREIKMQNGSCQMGGREVTR